MKVMQISKLYAPKIGGIEHVVQQIAEGLKDSVDMQVLVCREKGKSSDETVNGVRVHRCSSFGIALSMPLSFSILRDVRRMSKNMDILHIHMPFPLGDLALLFSGYKGKVIVWWHMDIVRQRKLMFLYKPLRRWVLNRADVIIVATTGHIEGSEALHPYRKKIVVIPFGVDESILDAGKTCIEKASQMKNPVTFLFIGRLVYYKGCDMLLHACATMYHTDAVLRLIGDGPMKDELLRRTEELGLSSRVTFLGSVSDEQLKDEIARCDVFVLPSSEKTEAFGIVQIEAMAYGKPVVNTNLPTGVPYVSLHEKTGLTVPPNDVKSFADAMDQLAGDVSLRQRFGLQARKRVEQEFRLTTMLERVKNVYEKVLGV